jgi:hypothetical protein
MQQTGQYVSAEDIYNAQLDWCRVQSIDNPERYFTDPSSEEAQQAQQQRAQQEQQQQEFQMQMLQMQKEVEDRKADNADAKVLEDARQADQEIEFKYWKEGSQAATQEALKVVDMVQSIGQQNQSSEDSGESFNTTAA